MEEFLAGVGRGWVMKKVFLVDTLSKLCRRELRSLTFTIEGTLCSLWKMFLEFLRFHFDCLLLLYPNFFFFVAFEDRIFVGGPTLVRHDLFKTGGGRIALTYFCGQPEGWRECKLLNIIGMNALPLDKLAWTTIYRRFHSNVLVAKAEGRVFSRFRSRVLVLIS